MSINRGLDKEDVVYIYMTEHYSAVNKNEIISFVATWMDLESVILNAVSRTEEKYHMTSLVTGI